MAWNRRPSEPFEFPDIQVTISWDKEGKPLMVAEKYIPDAPKPVGIQRPPGKLTHLELYSWGLTRICDYHEKIVGDLWGASVETLTAYAKRHFTKEMLELDKLEKQLERIDCDLGTYERHCDKWVDSWRSIFENVIAQKLMEGM